MKKYWFIFVVVFLFSQAGSGEPLGPKLKDRISSLNENSQWLHRMQFKMSMYEFHFTNRTFHDINRGLKQGTFQDVLSQPSVFEGHGWVYVGQYSPDYWYSSKARYFYKDEFNCRGLVFLSYNGNVQRTVTGISEASMFKFNADENSFMLGMDVVVEKKGTYDPAFVSIYNFFRQAPQTLFDEKYIVINEEEIPLEEGTVTGVITEDKEVYEFSLRERVYKITFSKNVNWLPTLLIIEGVNFSFRYEIDYQKGIFDDVLRYYPVSAKRLSWIERDGEKLLISKVVKKVMSVEYSNDAVSSQMGLFQLNMISKDDVIRMKSAVEEFYNSYGSSDSATP